MYPTLFRFAWFEIYSYSVMLVLSFAGGALLAASRARTRGLDPFHIVRLSLYVSAASLVGARLGYALVNYRSFADNLFDIYHNGVFQLSGLVMNGGILASLATVWAFAAFHGLPVLRILDVLAPSLGLGILLTRIGCFLNGCCFGLPTDLSWGVIFPAHSPAGHYQRTLSEGLASLHPTQLYAALGGLAIFVILLVFERRRKAGDGGSTFLLFILYGLVRFGVEFFRYNDDHVGLWLGLTHNQHVSMLFFLAGMLGVLFWSERSRQAGPVPPASPAGPLMQNR